MDLVVIDILPPLLSNSDSVSEVVIWKKNGNFLVAKMQIVEKLQMIKRTSVRNTPNNLISSFVLPSNINVLQNNKPKATTAAKVIIVIRNVN